MTDLTRLKKDLLVECKDDHVGLWTFIKCVRLDLGVADPGRIRRLALEIIQEFLESGLVQAGFPTADGRGFKPWSLAPEEAVARINSEWDVLGREPNIGDIVWFTTTEKGDKEVEAVAV